MAHRIIGCGSADRGDDAAGLLVVGCLRKLGIEACEHRGDGPALIDRWQGQETVILIDAMVSGGVPGSVTVWDEWATAALSDCFRCSTHAFGVAEAVKLARVLGLMPARLVIYGIEGRRFDLGSAPSPEVVAAAQELAHRLSSDPNDYLKGSH
jgi:hydrogenase maturation protease